MTGTVDPTDVLTLAAAVADGLLDEAVRSAATDGGPFAALVLEVGTGRVLSQATNRVTATNDPTAHAEVNAVRAAGAALGTPALTGMAVVSSCEPCPMCLAACLWARVDAVVFLATRDDAAAAGFDDDAFHDALGVPDPLPSALAGMTVRHLPNARAGAPFDAWAANAGRHPY